MRLRFLKDQVGRRARFRLRTMMIVVVLAALPLGAWAEVEARRVRFRRAADYHRSCLVGAMTIGKGGTPYSYGIASCTPSGGRVSRSEHRLDWWHLKLHEKYLKAADHPWLPVEPDEPLEAVDNDDVSDEYFRPED